MSFFELINLYAQLLKITLKKFSLFASVPPPERYQNWYSNLQFIGNLTSGQTLLMLALYYAYKNSVFVNFFSSIQVDSPGGSFKLGKAEK